MISEYLRLNLPIEDKEFDSIYPLHLRKLSKRHFTEVEVAIKASQLLVTKPKQKILDIGSGLGKFCFVASSYTDAHYTGVDYRRHFIELCEKLAIKHRFKNVNFIHADIKEINFRKYDSFYFYNSFEEHIDDTAKLDDTIETQFQKFTDYTGFLNQEFDKLPDGTRIVTYHAYAHQIPNSYTLLSSHFNGLLKCWEKLTTSIG